MRKVTFIIIIISLVAFITRNIYQYQNGINYYFGSVISSTHIMNDNMYRIINPNNLLDYIELDFNKYGKESNKNIYSMVWDNGDIYFLSTNDINKISMEGSYNILKILNGKAEILPVEFPHAKTERAYLYGIEEFLILTLGENIYFISKDDYQVNHVYDNRKYDSMVIPYEKGIITISKNNEIIYLEKGEKNILCSMPEKYTFMGCFKKGKSFLVYDEKEGESIIINLEGMKTDKFGNQPYRVLGNMSDDNIVLEMLPKAGGATPLDFEIDWWDLLRKEHKIVFLPFIYNIKTKNIKNLKLEDGFKYSRWENIDFDKSYFTKLSKELRQVDKG